MRRYVAYGADGSRQVLERASRFTTHAELAPGCTRVAERRRRMPLGGRGVLVRDLGGPPLAELPYDAPGSPALLGFSADGNLVAAGRSVPEAGVEIVVADVATGALRLLTGGGSAHGLAWSPAGDRIAVFIEGALQLYEADGTPSWSPAPGARADGGLAWSPDGSRIAFSTQRPWGVSHYVVAAEHDAPHRLLATTPGLSSTPPAWSPDGTRIAVGGG